MSDDRPTSYCTTREVSLYLKPTTQTAVSLQADTGASQTDADRIYLTLANTANFVEGDWVRVYDDASTKGEIVQIQDISENGDSSYLETVSDLAQDYTTANNAKVQLLSKFTRTTTPSSWDVNNIINRMEDFIDEYTHTAWRIRTAPPCRPPIKPMREGYHNARYFARIYLPHTNIITFVSGTDKFHVWDGSSETEYVENKTNARGTGDYWLCEERGFVDLYASRQRLYTASVRFESYRYGIVDSNNKPNPPKDIQDACAKLVAAEILMIEPAIAALPGGDEGPKPAEQAERYKTEAMEVLDRHKRMTAIL